MINSLVKFSGEGLLLFDGREVLFNGEKVKSELIAFVLLLSSAEGSFESSFEGKGWLKKDIMFCVWSMRVKVSRNGGLCNYMLTLSCTLLWL